MKIPCHVLAAKFLDQCATKTVVFDPTVADVLDNKKWVISMVQTVEKKTAFWSYVNQFKGNEVMELKCPINCICIQATWCATLKEDKKMNSGRGLSPFESPKDEQE